MRAVVFRRHGGPEVLEEAELPDPKPLANEVRVRIKATALNHLDLWIRKGLPTLPVEFPHILGADIAGVVDQVGEDVRGVAAGDEVIVQPGLSCMRCEACLSGRDNYCPEYKIFGEHVSGGYAELICVPHHNVVPKPAALTWEEAASAPLVLMTAWEMLVKRAALVPGETVLVHAAGSGVGSAGVQIAKLHGAKVIATASTEEKRDKALELGADHVVDYASGADWVKEVKGLTAGKGVEVVFDHVGEITWNGSVRCLRNGGRLVTCGATTGYDVKVDLRHLFYRRLSLLGSTMGSKGDLIQIVRLMERGELKAVIDTVLPLSKAKEAHERLANREQFGKVVLLP